MEFQVHPSEYKMAPLQHHRVDILAGFLIKHFTSSFDLLGIPRVNSLGMALPWLEPPDIAEEVQIPTDFKGLDIHQFEFGETDQQTAFADWLKHQELPFSWDGNPTENKVACSIAYILRQEGIPCFLWGWWAASLLAEHNEPFVSFSPFGMRR